MRYRIICGLILIGQSSSSRFSGINTAAPLPDAPEVGSRYSSGSQNRRGPSGAARALAPPGRAHPLLDPLDQIVLVDDLQRYRSEIDIARRSTHYRG